MAGFTFFPTSRASSLSTESSPQSQLSYIWSRNDGDWLAMYPPAVAVNDVLQFRVWQDSSQFGPPEFQEIGSDLSNLNSTDALELTISAPGADDSDWTSCLSLSSLSGSFNGQYWSWTATVGSKANTGFRFRVTVTVTAPDGSQTIFTVDPELAIGDGGEGPWG